MRHPRTSLPTTERDPTVVLLGARSTKNAERGGLPALGGCVHVRGHRCRGRGRIARMFGYGCLENGARVGIALAAKLIELRHILLEQATLGLGRDVPFHDGDDVVAQFLARAVARKIALISREGAGGRRRNRGRGPGHLQKFDQVVRGHRILRSPVYDHAAMARKWQRRRGWLLLRSRRRCWRSALTFAQIARFGARGRRTSGRRREASRSRLLSDC